MPSKTLLSPLFILIILPFVNLEAQQMQSKTYQAPIAERKSQITKIHDTLLVDHYYWLRDDERKDEKVLDYLKKENTYTEKKTAHTGPLQKELYDEMLARIQETDLSVPEKIDDYYYYSRTQEGKGYRIYCRKKGSLEAEEEILLDENELAGDLEYFSLGAFEISDDHNLLAYSTDTNGSEEYDLVVKDLRTGQLLEDRIENIAGSVVWAADHRTLLYTRHDETQRPYQLFKHQLGSKDEDPLIYQEDDPGFYLYASKTKNDAYIILYLGNMNTSEIRFLKADDVETSPQLFSARETGVEYAIENHTDHFYILTNENALNFKLMKCSTEQLHKDSWEEVLPHDPKIMLTDVEAFADHLVIYRRKGGYKNILIRSLSNNDEYEVPFEEEVFTFWGADNPDFNSSLLRFTYSSLVTPRTVYDYDMNTRQFNLLKEYEVLGDYDKSKYEAKRLYATAEDGTKIPVSLVHKKGIEINGSNPTYLYGYGSYGASMNPYFSSSRISLLDRGFVFAIAHIRGGSEMGRQWYEDGKMLHKKNTFTDFISCAELLIEEGYTSKDRLAISGGSAGGLLMGAVVNMRPDLFGVAVADVPFVDVINTMLDESIPLTVIEYDEWGNPNEKEYFDYMLSYSPYNNVQAQDYPNMLITAGLNDPRVQYWEPAKWAALLRATKTDDNTLLLKTHMGAGHGGKSGRYGYLEDVAFEYAFILDVLGAK